MSATFYPYLTGFENLDMVGRLYGLGRKRSKERARELLFALGRILALRLRRTNARVTR